MEELSDSDGELEDSKEDQLETFLLRNPSHTSPSTFSLINVPSDLECTPEEGSSITTRFANELGLWKNTSADTAPRTPEDEGKFEAVRQTDDTDESEKHQMLTELAGRRTMGETSISQRSTRASVCAPR
ncbi:hypothetical protein PQX77_015770 [Marasmius sp. AFHP31]|nr:hypothetical protein PQX77_015770 [Marasmius sp. AFHP31]